MPESNLQPEEGTSSSNTLDNDEQSTELSEDRSIPSEKPLLSFFIPNLTTGGAEQITINIVNGLSARGYEVELLISQYKGEIQSQLSSGVNVVELPPTRKPVLGLAAHLPALVAYLRRTEPTVLFPQMAHVSVVCLAARKLSNSDTMVVPTHHTGFSGRSNKNAKSRITQQLLSRLYPSADRIIAVSEGLAKGIVEHTSVKREKISVLYNPIHVDEIHEKSQEPIDHRWMNDDDTEVLLFVGRIEQQKDLETWLRAFKRVHRHKPETRAVIAGKGSSRESLETLATQLEISDAVSFPGYVENQYAYMRRASVFALSSQYEGLPTVLIEALACGCPVVATDCPSGPREILVDGEYGPLVPVGDSSELAEGIMISLKNPVSSSKLRQRAAEFAPGSVLDDYEKFLDEYIFSR